MRGNSGITVSIKDCYHPFGGLCWSSFEDKRLACRNYIIEQALNISLWVPERLQIKIYDLETSPCSLHIKTPIVLVKATIFEERKQRGLRAKPNISMQSHGFLVKCQWLWPWHVHGRAARERCHLLSGFSRHPWAVRRTPKSRVRTACWGAGRDSQQLPLPCSCSEMCQGTKAG